MQVTALLSVFSDQRFRIAHKTVFPIY